VTPFFCGQPHSNSCAKAQKDTQSTDADHGSPGLPYPFFTHHRTVGGSFTAVIVYQISNKKLQNVKRHIIH